MVRCAIVSGFVLLIGCGCTPVAKEAPKAATKSTATPAHPAGMQLVTLHVPEMRKRLDLTWLAWPNRVLDALSGHSGVEMIEVDLDKDQLAVRFNPGKVNVETMLEVVGKQGFQAQVVANE